ncbi:MAG TPA: hypothetical protein VF701_14380, partial [Thermoanaerobaculia bacterium]
MHETGQADTPGRTGLELFFFFLLVFCATWAAWFAAASAAGNRLSGSGGPLFLAGVFAPAFVALTMTALSEGRGGVVRLLVGVGRWKVGVRYYLFALAYLPVCKLLGALVHRIASGRWPAFDE